MDQYVIDPYFKNLLPIHDEQTYKRLEEQILREGCLDPLRVWKGRSIIIDGHTRYEICLKHGLAFTVVELEFETREEVEQWIYLNQLARRDLTDKERRYYLGKLYKTLKEENAATGKKKNVLKNLAEESGSSTATIQRAEEFADLIDKVGEVSPELKAKVLSKEVVVPPEQLQEVVDLPPREAQRRTKALIAGTTTEPEEAEQVVRDSLGNVVTNVAFHEIFTDVELFHEILRDIKGIEGKIRRLCKSAGGFGIHEDEMKLTRIKDELDNRIPWCICSTCKGHKTVMVNDTKLVECPECAGFGVLTKFSYQRRENKKKKVK